MSKKVLLYSGGLDSWLIDKLWKPDVKVYVNIHGRYNASEMKRLPDDVEIVDMPFLGKFELENSFVPLRNLYFLMVASHYGDEVCLGATAGDWGNKDKTPEFLGAAEELLQYLWSDKKTNRHVEVCGDFIYRPKTSLLNEYLVSGGNIEQVKNETFSCYTPENGHECFHCYPCFRKYAILSAFGAQYSEEEEARMWEYVKAQIIPTKEEGGYQGTYYTQRGEESQYLIKTVSRLREKYE